MKIIKVLPMNDVLITQNAALHSIERIPVVLLQSLLYNSTQTIYDRYVAGKLEPAFIPYTPTSFNSDFKFRIATDKENGKKFTNFALLVLAAAAVVIVGAVAIKVLPSVIKKTRLLQAQLSNAEFELGGIKPDQFKKVLDDGTEVLDPDAYKLAIDTAQANYKSIKRSLKKQNRIGRMLGLIKSSDPTSESSQPDLEPIVESNRVTNTKVEDMSAQLGVIQTSVEAIPTADSTELILPPILGAVDILTRKVDSVKPSGTLPGV